MRCLSLFFLFFALALSVAGLASHGKSKPGKPAQGKPHQESMSITSMGTLLRLEADRAHNHGVGNSVDAETMEQMRHYVGEAGTAAAEPAPCKPNNPCCHSPGTEEEAAKDEDQETGEDWCEQACVDPTQEEVKLAHLKAGNCAEQGYKVDCGVIHDLMVFEMADSTANVPYPDGATAAKPCGNSGLHPLNKVPSATKICQLVCATGNAAAELTKRGFKTGRCNDGEGKDGVNYPVYVGKAKLGFHFTSRHLAPENLVCCSEIPADSDEGCPVCTPPVLGCPNYVPPTDVSGQAPHVKDPQPM